MPRNSASYLDHLHRGKNIVEGVDLQNKWTSVNLTTLNDQLTVGSIKLAKLSEGSATATSHFVKAPTLSLLTPRLQLFDFANTPPSTENLPASLTLNSIAETPVFRYRAYDALSTDWPHYTYGENLDIAGSGTNPYLNNGSPLLGNEDTSVKFNGGKYFTAANTAFADITTEDFVIELVLRAKSEATDRYVISKYGGANASYSVRIKTNNRVELRVSDSVPNTVFISTDILPENTYCHAICFIDRSGFAQWYVNGILSGSARDVSGLGSLTNSISFNIGALGASASPFTNNITYAAMWKRSAWMSTHLNATVAQERFNQLIGLYPDTATGSTAPSVQTRASAAYVEKEGQAYNKIPGASDLESNYTEVKCTLTNEQTSVNNIQLANLAEDGTAGTHYIYPSTAVSFINGQSYTYSAYLKAINRNWVRLFINDNGTFRHAYFDLSTGSIGTVTNLTVGQYGITDLGGGFYRCWIAWTHTNTETRSPEVDIASGDGSLSFTGLSQDSFYVGGIMIEQGVLIPSDYISQQPSLFLVGNHWLKSSRYVDSNSVELKGYHPETEVTNLIIESDPTTSNWTVTQASLTANQSVFLDGEVSLSTFAEDNNLGAHDCRTTVGISFTTGTKYCFSAYVKAINRDWIRMSKADAAGDHICYFDLGNGVSQAESNVDDSGVINCGNGVYRCWFTFTNGETTSRTPFFHIATGYGSIGFQGINQDSLYIGGTQIEVGTYPTTLIPTSGATATRIKDILRYVGDDGNITNNEKGTALYDILHRDANLNTFSTILDITDGGASTERIFPALDSSQRHYLRVVETTNQVDRASTSTDLTNGEIRDLQITWQVNDTGILVDGIEENSDYSCTIPDDLDRIEVGCNLSGDAQLNGLLRNVRIYNITDRFPLVAGEIYSFSVYAKAINRDWIKLQVSDGSSFHLCYFNISTGAAGTSSNIIDRKISEIETGVYRVSITWTQTNTQQSDIKVFVSEADADDIYDGLSQDSVYVGGAQIEHSYGPNDFYNIDTPTMYYVGANAPKNMTWVDTDHQSLAGFAIEPTKTNLYQYSGDYTNAYWTKSEVSFPGPSIPAPDGLGTMYLMQLTTNNTSHQVQKGVNLTAGVYYCMSSFIKVNDTYYDNYEMFWNDLVSASGAARFTLYPNQTVILVGGSNTNVGIIPYGNGIFRVYMSWLQQNTSSTVMSPFRILQPGTQTAVWAPASEDRPAYGWGAQLEANAIYPSTYIPTVGATATRLVDPPIIHNAGPHIGHADIKQGSFVIPFIIREEPGAIHDLLRIYPLGSSTTDYILVQVTNFGNIKLITRENSNPINSISETNNNADNAKRFLVGRFADGRLDLAIYKQVDGTISHVTPDTSVTIPISLDSLEFTNTEFGIVGRNFKVWPFYRHDIERMIGECQ